MDPATPPEVPSRTDHRRPWGLLLHGARSAFDARKLLLAVAGLLLLQAGWDVLGWAFPGSREATPRILPVARRETPEKRIDGDSLLSVATSAVWRLTEPARTVAQPLAGLVSRAGGWGWLFHVVLAVLWAVIVWGIVGGALARTTLLALAGNGRPGHLGPLKFAVRFAAPLVAAPLYPLGCASGLAVLCAGIGLVGWLPLGIGPALSRVLFLVPLLLAMGMAVFVLGMVAGWPLIDAAIAAEEEDGLVALSRCLSYLNRRLGKFVGCVLLTVLIGVPCLLGVDVLAWGVPRIASWAVSLTAPEPVGVPRFWQRAADLLGHAWIYAYFWTQTIYVYLILRCDVDGTPWTVDPACDQTTTQALGPVRAHER
jgi:hypothetical protein